jgi:transcriptional regulator with XRE-family HTH domain
MDVLECVAKRIRELRESGGLSQQQLAGALDVAANTVSRWETGTYKPSLADLDRLSQFFNVAITSFFPDQPMPKVEDETLSALMRAAKELKRDDLEELRQYAEFRRARELYGDSGRPRRRTRGGQGT